MGAPKFVMGKVCLVGRCRGQMLCRRRIRLDGGTENHQRGRSKRFLSGKTAIKSIVHQKGSVRLKDEFGDVGR